MTQDSVVSIVKFNNDLLLRASNVDEKEKLQKVEFGVWVLNDFS